MDYFFDSKILAQEKKSEDFFSNRELFRRFNFQKKKNSKCSANKICRNDFGEIMAIRCNCHKKTYHLIFDGVVDWNFSVSKRNIGDLSKIPLKKALWVLQD